MSETVQTCSATTARGQPCQARAAAGTEFCFFHDPEAETQRKQARHDGGVARARPAAVLPAETPDPALSSVADVTAILGETIRHVRKGQLDPKIANTVGYLASVLLKALDMGELERRLEAVEAVVASRGPAAPSSFDMKNPLLPAKSGGKAA